jgi:Glycosyl hydrolases family 15
VAASAAALVSGGSRSDPHTPAALAGMPAPFLGVAVVGSGRRAAAVDAYGDVVDLRAPGPAGRALVAVSADRQSAGTVARGEAIVARAGLGSGRALPFWRADSVRQRYVPGTNVLRTVALFGGRRAVVVRRSGGPGTAGADRRWLARARPLGAGAPRWARALYRRSLLVLRALTDRRSGAVAAGARDGWAYVWPRDAAAVAIALAAAGYQSEARQIARFLKRLDLGAAARFRGTGAPLPGRPAQGDASGWVEASARAAGLEAPQAGHACRNRADYQEGDRGDYLANAIACGARVDAFERRGGLVRAAGDPHSGFDSAAAWAVRPFPRPALFPTARRSLLALIVTRGTRFGIVPSQNWQGGDDPWTAPTAWTAWALATIAGHERGSRARRAALGLIGDLRRAATPLGLLPERVSALTGLPTSTTPLAWSHAFAILALRELWPR